MIYLLHVFTPTLVFKEVHYDITLARTDFIVQKGLSAPDLVTANKRKITLNERNNMLFQVHTIVHSLKKASSMYMQNV